MIIEISVKNKIATLVDPDKYGVCHNGDYIVRFDFDAEWDEFTTKTMRINYSGYSDSVIFSGNECTLPIIGQPGPIEIGVFAGDLHTTTPATISFIKSIASAYGPEPDPTPDVYAQIIKMLDNLSVGSSTTKDGTVVSPNADFAEVAKWADGNPDNEDRTGYFVCANVPVDGIVMKKATSVDDVKGVTIKNPAFAGNYTEDKLDSEGNLLPEYSFVAIIGFVPVIDNGTCEIGGRCMPDDNGCAIPSSNSMGYQVVNRIDENRVLIIIEPNGDMVQRIKTKVNDLQNNCASTIKSTLSCKTPHLTVNDVSPVPHKCSCKLTSDTYETEGSINIYNFNSENMKFTSEWAFTQGTFEINENGTITYEVERTRFGVWVKFYIRDLIVGETYTFSLEDIVSKEKVMLKTFTFSEPISPAYPLTLQYSLPEASSGTLCPQLELGAEAHEWQEYVPPIKPYIENFSTVTVTAGGKTYTPSADGTVTDIASVSPVMEVTTDNEYINIVEFTYNVDTKTYIDATKVGEKTANDGEIFNDYENNIAGCMGFKVVKAYLTEDRQTGKPLLGVFVEGNVKDNIDISSIEANQTALGLENSVSLQWGNNYDLSCNVYDNVIEYDDYNKCTDILLSPVPPNFNESLATSGYIWFPTNPEIGNVQLGAYAHAEGCQNKAIQIASHSEGYNTIATGKYAHTEGYSTVAVYAAHAEGHSSQALGQGSHAEGCGTKSKGYGSHTEGGSTVAEGKYSHAEGEGSVAKEYRSHAEGHSTIASGKSSHAEGSSSEAQGENSHAEGQGTKAIGMNSHAEGKGTTAEGAQSHAEGSGTKATNNQSHAEGNCSEATGISSHAEGNYAKASGKCAHAENNYTNATGEGSHAEGNYTNANGQWSHAEGSKTHANGVASHAGGTNTQANADYSFAHGEGVRAQEQGQFVCGTWNNFNDVANAVFVVGNGTSSSARNNAFMVMKDGSLILGGVKITPEQLKKLLALIS